MKLIAELITEEYGERCPDFDPRCHTCKIWAEYDEAEGKIEGLSADLENAVEVAFNRGADTWTRLNYPDRYAILKAKQMGVGE
jgi:hypothetical protein